MTIEILPFTEFARRYCERQEQTPDGLQAILRAQRERYQSTGWMLLQCEMMDSSRCGEFTILPFGPNNTHKDVPDRPISPRGLYSDMSMCVAVLMSKDLP